MFQICDVDENDELVICICVDILLVLAFVDEVDDVQLLVIFQLVLFLELDDNDEDAHKRDDIVEKYEIIESTLDDDDDEPLDVFVIVVQIQNDVLEVD